MSGEKKEVDLNGLQIDSYACDQVNDKKGRVEWTVEPANSVIIEIKLESIEYSWTKKCNADKRKVNETMAAERRVSALLTN